MSDQVVPAGVVDHPALFDHCGAFPLGVFDGLNHSHQRDVAACRWAAGIRPNPPQKQSELKLWFTQTVKSLMELVYDARHSEKVGYLCPGYFMFFSSTSIHFYISHLHTDQSIPVPSSCSGMSL